MQKVLQTEMNLISTSFVRGICCNCLGSILKTEALTNTHTKFSFILDEASYGAITVRIPTQEQFVAADYYRSTEQ